MNDVVKPYCHQCSQRHFKDESCIEHGLKGGNSPIVIKPLGPDPDRVIANICPICERRRMKQRELMRKRRAEEKK